jgi:diguanylate cyclase (GGDEF)-like protein
MFQKPAIPADNWHMDTRGTWLCPTTFDRERLVDMEAKIAPARALMFGCVGLGLLSGIPWFGWWIVVLLVWVVVFYRLLTPWIARSARPEYPIALSLVHAQVMLGIAVALTGGPRSPALPFLLLGVILLPARFTTRGVIAGVVMTVVVILASTIGVDPSGYADDPTYVNASLATLGGLASISYALMRSERQQRSDAILDPLTGLLNRKALMDRFAEIEEQAAVTGGWVSLIACDLDHFKAINDEHGHERGDAVLRDAADVIRHTLRSFELVYRMGGEEFLIVLPGATLEDAQPLAERARVAMEDARPGGLPITVSMGVAAGEGADVVFEALFRRTDEALYRAKREGRNRVVVYGAEPALALARL